MADDVHAIIMIVTLIATGVILIKHASPKKTWEQFGFVIVRFLVIFAFFFTVAPNFSYPLMKGGYASSQFWITGLCICVVSILVHNKKVLSISIGILFCINILLCKHYVSLLKSHHFIGKKNYSTLLERGNRASLENAREALFKAGKSDTYDYPEGWLSDAMNKPEQKELRRYLRFDSTASKQHDLWHSWLTGIYSLNEWGISLWYSGGMLRTSGPEVVYKIKDKKPNNGVEQRSTK